jgi:hypothetical protein
MKAFTKIKITFTTNKFLQKKFNIRKQFIKASIYVFVLTAFFAIKSFSQTVYVQETGKKYHSKNCSAAGTGKKGMTIVEAKKEGYTACKVCKPDDVAVASKPKEKLKAASANKPKK